MIHFDVYWSFRSPYCYLLGPRLRMLEREFDVCCHLRPVYPAAVRTPAFLETRDPLWFAYFARDISRCAEYLHLPLRWPKPDPVIMDPATRKYLDVQPLIRRLTCLGVAADGRGRGLAFVEAIGDLLWNGKTDNWHEGSHLADTVARIGLDLRELDQAIELAPAHFEDTIEQNQGALQQAGHWGVPLMVFDHEPFFGQDRFDVFKWRLLQRGMLQRTT